MTPDRSEWIGFEYRTDCEVYLLCVNSKYIE